MGATGRSELLARFLEKGKNNKLGAVNVRPCRLTADGTLDATLRYKMYKNKNKYISLRERMCVATERRVSPPFDIDGWHQASNNTVGERDFVFFFFLILRFSFYSFATSCWMIFSDRKPIGFWAFPTADHQKKKMFHFAYRIFFRFQSPTQRFFQCQCI